MEQLAIIQLKTASKRWPTDPKDLEKKIREMIRDREDEEDARLQAEEEARAAAEANPDADKPPPTATAGVGRGTWYFYDPQRTSDEAFQLPEEMGQPQIGG